MNFKKIKRKKDPFPKTAPVRVKNSYYTFSKEYPAAKIIKTKHVKSKKERLSSFFHIALAAFCFAALVCASFFAVSLGLKFSNKPLLSADADFSNESAKRTESLFLSGSMKALYMPSSLLSSRKELSAFIREIKRKDCNSVVIDFKTQSGKLVYSSQTGLARTGKCAIFDNETVKSALSLFESKGINVIARFFCFEDETASAAEPSFAVKYKDTQVLWHENLSEGTGKTWLNPYSSGACEYLLNLIGEISSMGVDGFLLESMSFPGGDLSAAGFPGEKAESARAQTLLSFVQKAKQALPQGCFLLLSIDANSLTSENATSSYADSLLRSGADGICLNTALRPENYIADKKSGYASMLSLFAQFKQKQSESAVLAPVIGMDEYSRKYIRVLESNGYESFMIFDENGNY